MWIELAEKKEYEDSSKLSGLRISFDKRIDNGRKVYKAIRKIIRRV